ncbi:hypothetical protein DNHGIG_22160 [Collibacillus ludicampi]|uniref:Uncharacterized protein n=1 Tax=Collibacillus ludicampi TaxID=2771369 RepID=A0AAV4LFT0_9BACL|nr:hypothetical protein DNHGIG_22160 [Collibacillus ludicampi]
MFSFNHVNRVEKLVCGIGRTLKELIVVFQEYTKGMIDYILHLLISIFYCQINFRQFWLSVSFYGLTSHDRTEKFTVINM